MLAECTAEPLTLRERFKLMSQGIVEKDAHLAYLGARSLLLSAAQLGYASLVGTSYRPLAQQASR
jgi:hypothetical protein